MARPQHLGTLLAVILAGSSASQPAAAIDAAVARQCNALVAKTFPPRVPGNPAAGSKAGDARQQRAYFKTCVDSNGRMDDAGAAEPAAK